MSEAAIRRVVRGMTKGLRARGYYDATHRAFEEARNEAFTALQDALTDGPSITLGCGGAQIVWDAETPGLSDEPARVLADRMFRLGVVTLRLDNTATPQGVGALLELLAETADRVRAAGGLAAMLGAEKSRGIGIFELDFGALFAGAAGDLSRQTAGDPVAERALKLVLHFHEAGKEGREALAVQIEQLESVESLGSFLDDLLKESAPGVAMAEATKTSAPPKGSVPPRGRSSVPAPPQRTSTTGRGTFPPRSLRLTAEDVAALAAGAYFSNQSGLGGKGAPEAELVKSAEVLADAMLRLSPGARFSLLARLAGEEAQDEPDADRALQRLHGAIGDSPIIDAVVSALVDKEPDSDAAKAIGNLIRRLRPHDSDRASLLQLIDGAAGGKGKRMGGVVWQEIRSRAMQTPGLGMLELAKGEVKDALVNESLARHRGQRRPFPGAAILQGAPPGAMERLTARAMVGILGDRRELSPALYQSVRTLIETLEQQGAKQDAGGLLSALIKRTQGDGSAPLLDALSGLLTGAAGASRSGVLAQADVVKGSPTMADLLLQAIEAAKDRSIADALVAKLASFDAEILKQVANQVTGASNARVRTLVKAACRRDPKLGVSVARNALRNPSLPSREIALKTLGENAGAIAVPLLSTAAGTEGDAAAKKLLGGDTVAGDAERALRKMQLVAVWSLGATRSREAVPHLAKILARWSLFTNDEMEESRKAAARALLATGTPEGQKLLEMGTRHRRRAIREACERALFERADGGDQGRPSAGPGDPAGGRNP